MARVGRVGVHAGGGTSTVNVASGSRQATSTPLVGPQVSVDWSMRFAFTTSALGPLPTPRIRHWIWPTPRSIKPVPWIEIWDGRRAGVGGHFGLFTALSLWCTLRLSPTPLRLRSWARSRARFNGQAPLRLKKLSLPLSCVSSEIGGSISQRAQTSNPRTTLESDQELDRGASRPLVISYASL